MAVKSFLKEVERLQSEHKEKKIPRRKNADQHDESNWLVSYADMMTLLCGFFIMLFSLAKLDEPKYEAMKEAVAKQFGGAYKSPTSEMTQFVTEIVQESGLKNLAVIRSDPYGVSIQFESTLFFDSLSADIRPQGRIALNRLIEKIAKNQIKELKEYPILIEGHTDNKPILSGIYPSNWELSAARAARVARIFIEHGFNPAKISATGMADSRPEIKQTRTLAGAWDETALAKNRRVVIQIFRPDVDPTPYSATTAH